MKRISECFISNFLWRDGSASLTNWFSKSKLQIKKNPKKIPPFGLVTMTTLSLFFVFLKMIMMLTNVCDYIWWKYYRDSANYSRLIILWAKNFCILTPQKKLYKKFSFVKYSWCNILKFRDKKMSISSKNEIESFLQNIWQNFVNWY